MFSLKASGRITARLFLGAAVAALALAPATAATATAASAAAPAAAVVDYVALGDSYAAGFGAGPVSGTCRTTANAYPRLWADTAVQLDFAACTGATSADVLGKQLGGLDAETDLVSLTVGANDLSLTGALRACAPAPQSEACTAALANITTKLTTALPGDLAKLLTAIRTAAPKAKIAVTGYSTPFADTAQCPQLPLAANLRTAGNTAMAGLNTLLAAQSAAVGATFVDAAKTFKGHELCTAEPWIVGAEGLGDDTAVHPNVAGQKNGYLAAFTAEVGSVKDVLAWIAERDAVPSPSPSATAPTEPTTAPTGPTTAPTDVAAPPADGGEGGGLPVTGPGIGLITGVGGLLVAIGVVAYFVWRPRKVRTVVE